MDRRERIANLANTLCLGARHEAAERHVSAIEAVSSIDPKARRNLSSPFHSFLSGWDAAMALRADELRDENQSLHGMVIDLCAFLSLKRCEHCNGLGCVGDLEECPHCDRGFVDAPAGEPEKVVEKIRDRQ